MNTYYIAQGTLFVLCGDLNGKEMPNRGYRCTQRVDPLHHTVDTNATL